MFLIIWLGKGPARTVVGGRVNIPPIMVLGYTWAEGRRIWPKWWREGSTWMGSLEVILGSFVELARIVRGLRYTIRLVWSSDG